MNNIVRVIILAMVICVITAGSAFAKTTFAVPKGKSLEAVWEIAETSGFSAYDGFIINTHDNGNLDIWEFRLWEETYVDLPEGNATAENFKPSKGFENVRRFIEYLFIETPSFCVHRDENGKRIEKLGEVTTLDAKNQPWWEKRTAGMTNFQKYLVENSMMVNGDQIDSYYMYILIAMEKANFWGITLLPTCR